MPKNFDYQNVLTRLKRPVTFSQIYPKEVSVANFATSSKHYVTSLINVLEANCCAITDTIVSDHCCHRIFRKTVSNWMKHYIVRTSMDLVKELTYSDSNPLHNLAEAKGETIIDYISYLHFLNDIRKFPWLHPLTSLMYCLKVWKLHKMFFFLRRIALINKDEISIKSRIK